MTVEAIIAGIKQRHNLSSVHIFDDPGGWRIFGFRRGATGYQASAENGAGATIAAALAELDRRLTEGPIHR
jgi:hypothetical protein